MIQGLGESTSIEAVLEGLPRKFKEGGGFIESPFEQLVVTRSSGDWAERFRAFSEMALRNSSDVNGGG